MADYKLEVLEAIKDRSGGGTIHQIGLMVARRLLEEDKNVTWDASGSYQLEKTYKRKIADNLNVLADHGYLFKHYTDNDGAPLNEDEVFTLNDKGKKVYHLKSSQFNVSYFLNEAQVQVNNEYLLRNLGVTLFPFNKNIKYNCEEMRDDNPTPQGKFGLLFINDYKRGIYLYIDHDDAPLAFIFMRKKHNIENQKENALKILEKRGISQTRATLILLENNSYDFLSIDAGVVVAEITKDKELYISNISEDILGIGSDCHFYDYEAFKEMVRQNVVDKKPMKSFEQLMSEGFFKDDEIRELKPNQKTDDYSHFSPVYFEMLRYPIVINMGK